jgi:2-keto-3-deoxy-L-rhamnonate aldolase RhmA
VTATPAPGPPVHQLRTRLRAGEVVFGIWTRNTSPTTIETLGWADWDFIVLDAEHGSVEPANGEDAIRAADLTGTDVIVRVPDASPQRLGRYLDAGAAGVQVPMIETRQATELAVAATRFPPAGVRGLGTTRATRYGLDKPLTDALNSLNETTLAAVQVETVPGLEAVEEIASTPGLDMVFVGPSDMGLALGVPGQPWHPAMQAAYERVRDAAAAASVAVGALVPDVDSARRWIDLGATYIALGLTPMLLQASAAALVELEAI